MDTAFFTRSLFTAKGYEVPQNFSKTELGYTEVGAKYLVHKDSLFITSVLAGVRLPTGSDESLTNPLDQGTGENVWGLGIEAVQSYRPASFVSLIGAFKSKLFLPDTKDRAVPLNENDVLPSLLPADGQVQPVRRAMGPRFDAEIGALFSVADSGFTFWGNYIYTDKATDSFSGPGDLYYEGLSRDTAYNSSAAEFGLGYSTITAYRQGKFFMPMQVTAQYNNTFAGTNAPKSEYGRVDLKVYF